MSSLTFKAVIGAVHVDPKKGIVKIQLEATSYVSLDELTSLGPQDESIRITLESEQTKIGDLTSTEVSLEPGSREERELDKRPYLEKADLDDVPDDEGEEGNSINHIIGEKGARWLKEAADRLKKDYVDDDGIERGDDEESRRRRGEII